MSEDNKLQPVQIRIDPIEEQKKVEAWGAYGKALYRADLTLQLQAQGIVNQLIDPTTPELISKAEQAYAIVKKSLNDLQQGRIAVTSKFDPVITRLMAHEKAVAKSLEKNYNAILKAKQDEKEAAKTKEAKAKELKEVEKQVLVYVADMHAAALNAQLALLSRAYKHALKSNLSVEQLPEFKRKLCARVNIENSGVPLPKITAKYNTQAEVDAEILKHFNPWPPNDYVTGFATDVEAKFSDWEQALQNKEAATDLDEKEVAETTGAITEQLEKQKVSAGLNALSVPIADDSAIKPLKEVWQIVDPETTDEVFAIINAFAVNRNLVQDAVTKIKPLNFSIKQMIAALIKVKTEDENFECTGITFIKKDKL